MTKRIDPPTATVTYEQTKDIPSYAKLLREYIGTIYEPIQGGKPTKGDVVLKCSASDLLSAEENTRKALRKANLSKRPKFRVTFDEEELHDGPTMGAFLLLLQSSRLKRCEATLPKGSEAYGRAIKSVSQLCEVGYDD